MKCHFVFDEETNQKYFIPGCYWGLMYDDRQGCTCYRKSSYEEQALLDKKESAKWTLYLEAENKRLVRIIDNLNKRKVAAFEAAESNKP